MIQDLRLTIAAELERTRARTAVLTEAVDDIAQAGRSGWPAARLLAPHLPLLLHHTTEETLPAAQDTLNRLTRVLSEAGAHTLQYALLQDLIQTQIRVLGPDHPDTLTSRSSLASALSGLGEYARAAELHQQALDNRARVLGPDHPDTLSSRNNLASALESHSRPSLS